MRQIDNTFYTRNNRQDDVKNKSVVEYIRNNTK